MLQTTVHPFSDASERTQVERLPLIELFTATWCPPCAPADRAIDRLLEERSPGLTQRGEENATADPAIGLAVLAYHPWPDQGAEDPYGIPEGHSRMANKYDAFWFPSTYVDGFLEDAPTTRSTQVDAGMEEVFYGSYDRLLQEAAAVPPGFTMTTSWQEHEGNVSVHLVLEATAQLAGPFYVRGALWDDHLRFRGSNGIDDHRMTVRALTGQVVLAELGPGQTWETEFTLRLPQGVDLEGAGLTFFVETAWSDDSGDRAGALMGLAGGSALVAATAVFVLRHRHVQGRRARPAPPAGAPAVGAPPPRTTSVEPEERT